MSYRSKRPYAVKHSLHRLPASVHASQIKARVFVAMSFRDDEEPALVDYWQAMQRAAARAKGNFELRRIDEIDGDFEIVERIYDEIDAADLVIADLTLSPANVYLELGYARGKGKRVIQTCREGTPLEFDVRGHKTLTYYNAATLEEKLLGYLDAIRAVVSAELTVNGSANQNAVRGAPPADSSH